MVNSNTTPHLIESDLISRIIIQIEDEIRPHSNEVLIISFSGRKRMFSLTNNYLGDFDAFFDRPHLDFFPSPSHYSHTYGHYYEIQKLNTPNKDLVSR